MKAKGTITKISERERQTGVKIFTAKTSLFQQTIPGFYFNCGLK